MRQLGYSSIQPSPFRCHFLSAHGHGQIWSFPQDARHWGKPVWAALSLVWPPHDRWWSALSGGNLAGNISDRCAKHQIKRRPSHPPPYQTSTASSGGVTRIFDLKRCGKAVISVVWKLCHNLPNAKTHNFRQSKLPMSHCWIQRNWVRRQKEAIGGLNVDCNSGIRTRVPLHCLHAGCQTKNPVKNCANKQVSNLCF